MNVYESLYRAERVRSAGLMEPEDFIVNLVPVLSDRKCENVLDVGCGAGRNTIFLAEQGFYPVGVDVASTALEIALRRADRAGLKNCLFIKIDFLRLSLRNRGFDAVISCYGIENQSLSGIRKALKEVKRIATDRGLVLVTLHSTNTGDLD